MELTLAASRSIERLVRDAAVASVQLEEVDVGRLAEDAVAAAVVAGGNVRAEIAIGLPLIEADPLRLRQALDNLVANALLHSGSTDEVVVRARHADGSVLISVVDTGVGVPRRAGTNLRKGCTTGRRATGIGIGLALARAIAEAHGGTLSVDSVPGQGATFNLSVRRFV